MRQQVPWRGAAALCVGLCATAVAALVLISPRRADSADPNALWHIVHDLCVTDMKASGLPAPCTAVDMNRGYAVLKDIRGATQLLLIPTARVGGIESPALLAPDAPNYFEDAWDSRGLFQKRTGRTVSREDVGLAINSIYGRSQNQLHIHIDCVRPDIQRMLVADQAAIGERWTDLDPRFPARRYRVRRIDGADLGASNPFKLLAEDPDARADMGRETLVLIGMEFTGGQPGFVLLSDQADLAAMDKGAAEELLDHTCAVLGLHNPPASG
jgi:CDP-diacylglycerol pyrophosphatase